MKFDLVEPYTGQAPKEAPTQVPTQVPTEVVTEAPAQAPAGDPREDAGSVAASPRLSAASERMHSRIAVDLATVRTSLNRLHEAVATAQRDEADEADAAPDAAPPENFRAGAFSDRPAPGTP